MLSPILKMMAQRSGANQCHTSYKWQSWHPNPSISVLDLPVTIQQAAPLVHCRAEQPQWRSRARKKSLQLGGGWLGFSRYPDQKVPVLHRKQQRLLGQINNPK